MNCQDNPVFSKEEIPNRLFNGVLSLRSHFVTLKNDFPLLSAQTQNLQGIELCFSAQPVSGPSFLRHRVQPVKGKYQRIVAARSLLCYWAVRELGIPMSNLSIKLGISIPSISMSVRRGQKIAEENEFTLLAS